MTWPFYPHDYAAGEIKSRWEGQPLSLSLLLSLCGDRSPVCEALWHYVNTLLSSDAAVRDFSAHAVTNRDIDWLDMIYLLSSRPPVLGQSHWLTLCLPGFAKLALH